MMSRPARPCAGRIGHLDDHRGFIVLYVGIHEIPLAPCRRSAERPGFPAITPTTAWISGALFTSVAC